MVFADEEHTSVARVLRLRTVKDVGSLVNLPASTGVSNFHHRLINPKGALRYIQMFKPRGAQLHGAAESRRF